MNLNEFECFEEAFLRNEIDNKSIVVFTFITNYQDVIFLLKFVEILRKLLIIKTFNIDVLSKVFDVFVSFFRRFDSFFDDRDFTINCFKLRIQRIVINVN